MVALCLAPLYTNAQVVNERHNCISLYLQSDKLINDGIGRLLIYKRKGVISYQKYMEWQNKIKRETEYSQFKLHQASYDGNDEICLTYYNNIVNILKTNLVAARSDFLNTLMR